MIFHQLSNIENVILQHYASLRLYGTLNILSLFSGVSSIRQPITVRTAMPANKMQGIKPPVPSISSRPTVKDKEKNTFSTYPGDDDINDVAAMGGVNLAEETQKILGRYQFIAR